MASPSSPSGSWLVHSTQTHGAAEIRLRDEIGDGVHDLLAIVDDEQQV